MDHSENEDITLKRADSTDKVSKPLLSTDVISTVMWDWELKLLGLTIELYENKTLFDLHFLITNESFLNHFKRVNIIRKLK